MTRNAVPSCSPDVVQRADVRMSELRDGARFAVEPFAELRIGGERVGQDLDRDRAVEARVARFVHLAHATGAKQRQDFVGAESRAGGQGHSLCDCTRDGAGTATNMPRLSVPSIQLAPTRQAPDSSAAARAENRRHQQTEATSGAPDRSNAARSAHCDVRIERGSASPCDSVALCD